MNKDTYKEITDYKPITKHEALIISYNMILIQKEVIKDFNKDSCYFSITLINTKERFRYYIPGDWYSINFSNIIEVKDLRMFGKNITLLELSNYILKYTILTMLIPKN